MKTVYIPKGETVSYESLVTDRLVVKGCLKATYGVKARVICGNGVICAGAVEGDDVRIDSVEAASVICKRLLAKRVQAPEVFASDWAVVSCFISSAYVETGRLTVAINEIDEIKADEVINLRPKKRGMFHTLLASALRAFWVSLTTPKAVEEPVDADYEPLDPGAEEPQDIDPALREEIAKTVQEILEQEKAAKAAETSAYTGDFELNRVVQTFKLLRDKGYTLRVVPGTPEENAPVFDFETNEIKRPAA